MNYIELRKNVEKITTENLGKSLYMHGVDDSLRIIDNNIKRASDSLEENPEDAKEILSKLRKYTMDLSREMRKFEEERRNEILRNSKS